METSSSSTAWACARLRLGHAYDPVVEAAYKQMQLGTNFRRPAKIEVDLAEAMLEVIDGADMVKFAKNGSDVTTAAVKLARAYTGRNLVAICGDQPFFSIDDWFIGTTEMNAGIPAGDFAMTLKFRYNDLDESRGLYLTGIPVRLPVSCWRRKR